MRLGEFIKEYRKNNVITQNEMAERLGITKTALSYVETCRRKAGPKIMKAIARELNLDIREVYKLNENNE